MKATQKGIDKALSLLAETSLRIANTMKGVDDALLQAKDHKKSWSANDILAHLRSCVDVWGKSIDTMLAEDNPTLPDVHPRQWIMGTDYPAVPFRESFQAFADQREKLLITLRKLSFDDWSRGATIGGHKHTVFSQARRMAKHENEHCDQIESLLQGAAVMSKLKF
jgi:uncharacterized damage-inducible protein DinB